MGPLGSEIIGSKSTTAPVDCLLQRTAAVRPPPVLTVQNNPLKYQALFTIIMHSGLQVDRWGVGRI